MHRAMLSSSFNGCDISSPDNPITKVLCELVSFLSERTSIVPLQSITLYHWPQNFQNLLLLDRRTDINNNSPHNLPIKFVQTLTVVAAAQHEIVGARGFSNTSKFSDPRPRTPIWTSCHPHYNTCVSETRFNNGVFQFRNERRKITFTFSHG